LLLLLLLHLQIVKKNSRVLVMCAVGGTLDTNVSYRRDKKLFAGEQMQHVITIAAAVAAGPHVMRALILASDGLINCQQDNDATCNTYVSMPLSQCMCDAGCAPSTKLNAISHALHSSCFVAEKTRHVVSRCCYFYPPN
jgi:hypothetical protein